MRATQRCAWMVVLIGLLVSCGSVSAYLLASDVDLGRSKIFVSPQLKFAGSHAVCLIFRHTDFEKLTPADFAEFERARYALVDAAHQLRIVQLEDTQGFDVPSDAKYMFAIVGEGQGSLRADFSDVHTAIGTFKIAIVKDPLDLKDSRTRWDVK